MVEYESPQADEAIWTPRRQAILRWLETNAQQLADIYAGAVRLLHDKRLRAQSRFVAHAVREIWNRLPDAVNGPEQSSRVQYTKLVDRLDVLWKEMTPPLDPGAAPDGTIPTSAAIIRQVENLVLAHREPGATRRQAAQRMFEALAPENAGVGHELNPIIGQWMDLGKWGHKVAHVPNTDDRCSATEMQRHFELLENMLASVFEQFYQPLSELDGILEEANG